MKFKFKRYLALFLTIMLMLGTSFSTIVKAEGEISGSNGQDCTLNIKILDKLDGESIANIDFINIFYLNGDWGFGNSSWNNIGVHIQNMIVTSNEIIPIVK